MIGMILCGGYGKRLRPLTYDVPKSLIEIKKVVKNGDGSQIQSFCYIYDMVDGICRMVFSDKAKGEIINLGNPDEITILELAKRIKKLTNSNSKIVFKKLPEDEAKIQVP